MSVDGRFIMANASHHSRIPREQFTEAAQVNYGARKYLETPRRNNRTAFGGSGSRDPVSGASGFYAYR